MHDFRCVVDYRFQVVSYESSGINVVDIYRKERNESAKSR